MRRRLAITILSVVLAGVGFGGAYVAQDDDGSAEPMRVAPDRWLPISDNVGILLAASPSPDGKRRPGVLLGKVNGKWVAIDLKASEEGGLFLVK
jgi:hypothetical protein